MLTDQMLPLEPISTIADVAFELSKLRKLNFEAQNENFVREKFIAPLLELLGYDQYEYTDVIRDGNKQHWKKTFVINGSKKIISQKPDYVPTIIKKIFWCMEIKSPKASIKNDRNILQGLQYAAHPEIDACYLVISNGKETAIYDVFYEIYANAFGSDKQHDSISTTPILKFSNTEIEIRWKEIAELLSVRTIRNKISKSMADIYDKMSLSSDDPYYPIKLSYAINRNMLEHVNKIIDRNFKHKKDQLDYWLDIREQELANMSFMELENEIINGVYPLYTLHSNSPADHYSNCREFMEDISQVERIVNNWSNDQYTIYQQEKFLLAICSLRNQLFHILNPQEFHKINLQHNPDDLEKYKEILYFIEQFLSNIYHNPLSFITQIECFIIRIYINSIRLGTLQLQVIGNKYLYGTNKYNSQTSKSLKHFQHGQIGTLLLQYQAEWGLVINNIMPFVKEFTRNCPERVQINSEEELYIENVELIRVPKLAKDIRRILLKYSTEELSELYQEVSNLEEFMETQFLQVNSDSSNHGSYDIDIDQYGENNPINLCLSKGKTQHWKHHNLITGTALMFNDE